MHEKHPNQHEKNMKIKIKLKKNEDVKRSVEYHIVCSYNMKRIIIILLMYIGEWSIYDGIHLYLSVLFDYLDIFNCV